MMAQELGYSLAIECLGNINVPLRGTFIRLIFVELTRLLNHLLALTTHALDVGAMTPFLWGFEEREKLMELYERVSGARMHANYIRPGGVCLDLNNDILDDIFNFIKNFSNNLLEMETMLHFNRIWKQRLVDIGVITSQKAINWSFSGVMLRSTGINWDLRKLGLFSNEYLKMNFLIPIGKKGDCFDRFLIRMEEMKESLKIIEYCINNLPSGSFLSNNLKVVPPTRIDMKTSMEGLIHHFKLFTEGFSVNKGELYFALEAPKGEFGVFLVTQNHLNLIDVIFVHLVFFIFKV